MAVVGLEQTFLRVSENIGVVKLCAIVRSPVVTCPIAFPFDVSLFFYDGTAGQLIVTVAVLNKIIIFVNTVQ